MADRPETATLPAAAPASSDELRRERDAARKRRTAPRFSLSMFIAALRHKAETRRQDAEES